MLTLQSPEDLQNYCLRALGSPVINIEIDQTQMDDRVDEALQFFIEQHYDGSVERYVKYTVTAADVTRGYLSTPENMPIILEIYDPGQGVNQAVEEFERLNFNIAQTDIFDTMNGIGIDLSTYYMARESISTLRDFFTPDRSFEFNSINREMKVNAPLEAGRFIFLHGYEALDPDNDINIYNDRWLKKYCTQLFKRQWGHNTKKYKNVQLAGGITADGKEIYDEAVDELNRLEEEFVSRYTTPPGFFMG